MAKTTNLELNLPAKEDKNWHVPTNENWGIVDVAVGKVSDAGNYSVVRNSLTKMVGLETGFGSRSLIKGIQDTEAVVGNKALLKDNDAYGSRNLNAATDVIDAINMLDGVWYEEIELEATLVSISPNDEGVTIGESGVLSGTPMGIGTLRWKQARNAFGFQAYGQGGEGSEVNVTVDVEDLLIKGQDDEGGVYIDVVVGDLPGTDQEYVVTVVCDEVVLEKKVGVWGTDKLLVLQDDNGLRYSFKPRTEYNVDVVTVDNDVLTVSTLAAGGYVSASGTVKVWYCVEDAQDTTTAAFKGFMLGSILDEVVYENYPDGDLHAAVEDILPATPSDDPEEGTIRLLKDGGDYKIAAYLDGDWRLGTLI